MTAPVQQAGLPPSWMVGAIESAPDLWLVAVVALFFTFIAAHVLKRGGGNRWLRIAAVLASSALFKVSWMIHLDRSQHTHVVAARVTRLWGGTRLAITAAQRLATSLRPPSALRAAR